MENRCHPKRGVIRLLSLSLLTSICFSLASCKKGNDEPAPTYETIKTPERLAIVYSWTDVINGANGDVNRVVSEVYKNFDVIVFGDNLWKTSHLDYQKTKEVIAQLKAAGKKVFLYLDASTTIQNLSEAKLKEAINGISAIGVYGVFADDMGSDFKVSRARQNFIIDYAHTKGLSVFVNAWNLDDILSGNDVKINNNDYILLESFGYGHGAYRSLAETISRGQKAKEFQKNRNFKIAAIATEDPAKISANSNTTAPFMHAYYASIIYNLDAFGFTDTNYSSFGAKANQVFIYPQPLTKYGTKFSSNIVKESDVLYRVDTDTHKLYLSDKTGYSKP
ncbi:hypothetical protein [Emticicia fontis]